jgi:hypothetical protein
MTMSCRAGGRVSSHRKSVRPAAEQAAAMITAVKVAVQARSEGFLVLHHVLGLAAARSEYNAGARQDGVPSPGVTPWIKFVAGACQPLPLCTERHLIERIHKTRIIISCVPLGYISHNRARRRAHSLCYHREICVPLDGSACPFTTLNRREECNCPKMTRRYARRSKTRVRAKSVSHMSRPDS